MRTTTFRLVDSNWSKEIDDAIRADHSALRIVCPFIKQRTAERLLSRGTPASLEVITRFNLADVCAGVWILRELSEIVYWSGRYPVPIKSGEVFQPTGDVPRVAFAHYMRDWLDPVLDYFQGEHAPPNDFDESVRRVQAIVESEDLPREA